MTPFKFVKEAFAEAEDISTGGGCTAIYVPSCGREGEHYLITDVGGCRIPQTVGYRPWMVGRYNSERETVVSLQFRNGYSAVEWIKYEERTK